MSNLLTPNYERYEGVRPINIYLLRVLYFLMAAFVATDAWMTIINHQGSWAAYPTLAVLWRANALWGSPAESMTKAFLWLPLVIIAVPWGSVFRDYVQWSKTRSFEQSRARAA